MSDPTSHTWTLEKVCTIYGVLWVFRIHLITVCFLVTLILSVLEGEALKLHLRPIKDYSLIQRFTSEAIFHSSDDLKFVIINHADVGDGGSCKPIVFVLVLFDKSTTNLLEAKFVIIEQFHLRFILN